MTDDMTVSEIREEVADIDDVETLEEMLEAERDGKDRTTAKDAIEDRIATLEDEAGSDTSDESDGDEVDGDEADSGEPAPDDDADYIRVRPAPGSGGGHIAGYSFEPNEVKHIPAEGKVQRALMRGKLQRVA